MNKVIVLKTDADLVKEMVEIQNQTFNANNPYNIRSWKQKDVPKNELPAHIKRDPFLWQCFRRLHYEDKNLLMLVIGETGVGKSCSAISLAYSLDVTPLGKGFFKRNFIVKPDNEGNPTPQTRIIFSAVDLIRLVRSGLPKGSVIIWDEAGIGNDNTDWYEKKSKLVKHVLQSFRAQNLCLILTVPDEQSIALYTRRLVHCVLNVKDRDEKFAYVDIQWLDRNRRLDKVYRKTQAFDNPLTGEPTKIADYLIKPLDVKLENRYKAIKSRVLDDLNAFYEKEMAAMEKLESDKSSERTEKLLRKFDLLECVRFVRSGHADYVWNADKWKFDANKIVFLLMENGWQCSLSQARTLAANLSLPKQEQV